MSFFRTPQGILLLAAAAVAVYVLFLSGSAAADTAPGPAYDLIFGVHTFDTSRKATANFFPYVIDGTLYVQAEKVAAGEDPGGVGLVLYRYDHRSGRAEPLPLPGETELRPLADTATFQLSATQHLTLSPSETSPDGYSLAEPDWVKVGPLSNLLGNLVLLLYSGKTEAITERETAPRLATHAGSRAIKAKSPLFANEAETAFLLGWVVPASPPAPGQQP